MRMVVICKTAYYYFTSYSHTHGSPVPCSPEEPPSEVVRVDKDQGSVRMVGATGVRATVKSRLSKSASPAICGHRSCGPNREYG